MGVKRKLFLKDDAVPTIFCFTKDKKQREVSVKRDERATKKRVSLKSHQSKLLF